MFDGLSERLSSVFDRLSGRGVLSEKDVDEALREVRVALPVVKDFVAKAKERATGEEVVRSVRPADMVVKIVHDGLVEMLGGDEPEPINLAAAPPAVILMAGLSRASPGANTAFSLRWTRPSVLTVVKSCSVHAAAGRITSAACAPLSP